MPLRQALGGRASRCGGGDGEGTFGRCERGDEGGFFQFCRCECGDVGGFFQFCRCERGEVGGFFRFSRVLPMPALRITDELFNFTVICDST